MHFSPWCKCHANVIKLPRNENYKCQPIFVLPEKITLNRDRDHGGFTAAQIQTRKTVCRHIDPQKRLPVDTRMQAHFESDTGRRLKVAHFLIKD